MPYRKLVSQSINQSVESVKSHLHNAAILKVIQAYATVACSNFWVNDVLFTSWRNVSTRSDVPRVTDVKYTLYNLEKYQFQQLQLCE